MRGVVIAMHRGPLGRSELARGIGIGMLKGGDKGRVVGGAVSGRLGVRSTKSEAGDGTGEGLTSIATRSVGDVSISGMGGEGGLVGDERAGRA